MAKKLKKVNKGMSPKTKNILVNSFKGIISNQSCIDNGKEAPWWLAVLFLLFAVFQLLFPWSAYHIDPQSEDTIPYAVSFPPESDYARPA